MNREINELIKSMGSIIVTIEHKDKETEIYRFPNTILNKGREVFVNFLINQKSVYVKNMLFGDGGMSDGIKKKVEADRNTLFGITRVNKPVIAQMDPVSKTQALFTAVIDYDDANGHSLNEMALQLDNEDLFSMATFPDIGKTEQMRLTWNWRINII